jgi:hypothetical protein
LQQLLFFYDDKNLIDATGLAGLAHDQDPQSHGCPTIVPLLPPIMVNFEQTRLSTDGTVEAIRRLTEGVMTSIVPFISNGVFESGDIKVMSDAYSKAIENIYGFGQPNRIVGEIIATRIITLTQGGERDADRLCERALAACGFSPARADAADTP